MGGVVDLKSLNRGGDGVRQQRARRSARTAFGSYLLKSGLTSPVVGILDGIAFQITLRILERRRFPSAKTLKGRSDIKSRRDGLFRIGWDKIRSVGYLYDTHGGPS
jgi:hypothetical protein